MTDWIASYLDYTSDHEAPERIHFWTALGVLSAALGRKVWMDRNVYKLYPNLYICIVANSAKVRKSIATAMGLELLLEAIPGITYIEDRMTPEGLVKQMNKIITTTNGTTVTVSHDSTMFIYEDEISALFGRDKMAAARMSDLLNGTYNCKSRYMHTTITNSQVIINNPCITILGATAPEGLWTIPSDAAGGLLGRLILVASGKKRKNIAWPRQLDPKLRSLLIEDLMSISQIQGPMSVTPEAREFFEVWYNNQTTVSFRERWMEAFHERCHDTALKTTILLSASRSDDQIVNAAHMEAGTKIIEDIIPDLKNVGVWLTPDPAGQLRAQVEDVINQAQIIRRSDVMKITRITAKEMDDLETTLEQQNYMRITTIGRDKTYEKIKSP